MTSPRTIKMMMFHDLIPLNVESERERANSMRHGQWMRDNGGAYIAARAETCGEWANRRINDGVPN